ncbi:hypothetical protein HK102_010141, partial [Quaeritorhiza haematococci]
AKPSPTSSAGPSTASASSSAAPPPQIEEEEEEQLGPDIEEKDGTEKPFEGIAMAAAGRLKHTQAALKK